jgi:mRNA interferase HicA
VYVARPPIRPTRRVIKRRKLERHLRAHGCELARHGAKHDVWRGGGKRRSTVPRHSEIPTTTARAICRQLGVPPL